MTRPAPGNGKGRPKGKPLKLGARRRAVSDLGPDCVSIEPLLEDSAFPTLIKPKLEGLRLGEWASANRGFLQSLWEEKRALLFRDFDLGGIPGFEAFTEEMGDGERLPYVDRSTPREEYGPNVYCTTIYPSELSIRLHNEGSYWCVHPVKAFFACITPPETGGETPIGDVHAVHERIAPEIREEFRARRWMLVRNYNAGFALRWQEVFQTVQRDEVEAYCRANHIQWEWLGEDGLRTKQVRDPILIHPRTGEALWHNHAAFFHISTREAHIRDALLHEFAEEELPYNTFFGDGGSIPPETIAQLNAAYDAELVKFRWQAGDVHWIDNLRLAHAREPYTGERLILVALKEPIASQAVA